MKNIFIISWRNIWRNSGRSGVLLAAIISGLWAGIILSAISNGFIEQRFKRLIENEISHVQVHHPVFLTEREAGMFIPDADAILSDLRSDSNIQAFTARTLADGMIQSPATTSGVQIRGVNPETEQLVTNLQGILVEGEYLDADVRNPVLIGQRLAEKLNVEIGNRVVLTFQDINNELTSASFNITGLFRAVSSAEEEGKVFTTSEVLSSHLSEDPVIHEIAVLMKNEVLSDSLAGALNAAYPDSEAQTWSEISPELRYLSDVGNLATYIVMIVILLALAFGILNTMLMAIFERTRELGMLLAIGMNKLRVFSMITLESVLLTLTGAAGGIVLALMTINYFSDDGLNLEMFGDGLQEFGYETTIYPVMNVEAFAGITLLVIITAILAAVYPAVKALRLEPAEAVRE